MGRPGVKGLDPKLPPHDKEFPGQRKLLGQRAEELEVQGNEVRGTKLWSALGKNSSGSINKKMPVLFLLTQKSGMKYFSLDFQQSFFREVLLIS